MFLSGASLRFLIDDSTAQETEFNQLRIVMRRCPIYELRRRQDMSQLSRTVDIVGDLFGSSEPCAMEVGR
jgi:hypothetical protein